MKLSRLSNIKLPAQSNSNIAWFLIVTAFFAVFSGSIYFWNSGLPAIIPSSKYLFVPCVTIAIFFFARAWKDGSLTASNPWPFALGLVFVFFSDWLQSIYSLYPGPIIRGEIILFAVVFILLGSKKFLRLLPLFFSSIFIILILLFYQLADGQLIFSDDLGTFFYRILLLKENFPNIPFYNPQWNAGMEQKDFFATGAIMLYLLVSPILHLTNIELSHFYNTFVLILGLILPVATTFFASKLLKLPKSTSWIACTLVISCSLFWFRWGFKYGTLGYITATALLPLVLALLINIAEQKQATPVWKLGGFCLLFTLSILWPFAGVVCLPALLLCVLYCGKACFSPKLLLTALILCLINLPWISTYFTYGNLSHFLTMDKKPAVQVSATLDNMSAEIQSKTQRNTSLKSHSIRLNKDSILKYFRDNIRPINPLLVFLLIPGIALLVKTKRNFYLVMSLWLLLLANIISIFKPQLELDRMYVVLSLLACIPVAHALEQLLNNFKQYSRTQISCLGLLMGFLITGPFCTARFFTNATPEHIAFTSPLFERIQKAIKNQHQKSGGRILFSGCVIHDFEDGHLAPLAFLTNVPLIASSHLHNLWWYKQVIPEDFLKRGDVGIEQYLDTYNISSVFAHEPTWRKYFSKRPDKYRLIEKLDSFWFFERINFTNNYVLEGKAGLIEQTTNTVTINPKSKELTLKFNFFANLKTTNCDIAAKQVGSIQLIKLKDCRLNEVTKISWGK